MSDNETIFPSGSTAKFRGTADFSSAAVLGLTAAPALYGARMTTTGQSQTIAADGAGNFGTPLELDWTGATIDYELGATDWIDLGTNSDRITVPTAFDGMYLVAGYRLETEVAGGIEHSLEINIKRYNSADALQEEFISTPRGSVTSATHNHMHANQSFPQLVTDGDYFTIEVAHQSGTTKDFKAGEFWVHVIGDPAAVTAQTPGAILIEKKEITANTTTTTFSGLDGNTDGVYVLKAFLVSDSGEAGVTNYYMNPNGVTTNQSCQQKNLSTTYTYASLTRTYIGSNASTANMCFTTVHIWARAAGPGATSLRRQFSADAQRGASQFLWTTEWNETATNITSLEIEASIASGIRIGSTLALYKLNI